MLLSLYIGWGNPVRKPLRLAQIELDAVESVPRED
jgi:hypothetical protein